jgi:uncharacterized short protein YbdD (DUF466 family)
MKQIEQIPVESFRSTMREKGWIYFEGIIEDAYVDELNNALPELYQTRRNIQVKNGIVDKTEGTIHHMLEQGNISLDFLARMYLDAYIRDFLDGNYILNSFGGLFNLKDNLSYTGNVHRDVRSWTGDLKLMINMLVMLDDFTLDNGATYLLTGSHQHPDKPTDEEFFAKADRAVGKRGSIILFDSMLWHATGENKTGDMRRALTLTFTRPFLKQQLDYPRYIGYENINSLSADLQQVIGFNARVPSTLDEWYQPPANRMYKPGQG